jgi:hypothetical protein
VAGAVIKAGNFYMAVIVAQLVGMKLAQAVKPKG